MSSRVSVKGSLYVQDTEDGYWSNNIPFEIYSDYSSDPTNTYFRQLQFSNVSNVYMGISNVGSYFYVSAPSNNVMTEQSNTFIVTSGGNVGIGKTDPADRLHVEGETLVRGSIGNFTSATVSDNIHTSNVVIGDGKLVVGVNPNHRIPTGTIALWENSTESTIPKGWTLFDAIGTNFVRGDNVPKQELGSDSVTFNNTHFPKHNHTTNTSSNYTNTGHTHNSPVSIENTDANHSHNISYTVDEAPYSGHHHIVRDYGNNSVNNLYEAYTGGGNVKRFKNSNANFTRVLDTSNHRHGIGPPNNSTIAQNAATHTHTVNTTLKTTLWLHAAYNISNTNGVATDNKYNIIPKHKSYVFIIKQ